MNLPTPRGWTIEGFIDHVRDVAGELQRRRDRRVVIRADLALPAGWTTADSGRTPRVAWRQPNGLRCEALGVAARCPLDRLRWRGGADAEVDSAELAAARTWLQQFPMQTEAILVGSAVACDAQGPFVPVELWLPRLWLREEADGRVSCAVAVVGDDALDAVAAELTGWLGAVTATAADRQAVEFALAEPPAAQSTVAGLIAALAAGHAQKVVWSRAILAQTALARSVLAARMAAARPDAWIVDLQLPAGDNFLAATPELLVSCRGEVVAAMALAGTGSPGSLERAGDGLRAEHAHVVAFIETQLAAGGVSDLVREPSIRHAGPLHHLHTRLVGRREPGTDALTLALRLHPTPALLGAPRAAALGLLAAAETPRGLYGGCVGRLACDGSGDGEVVVLLRGVAQVSDGWEARAGAGLVAQSDPVSECAEITAKLSAIVESIAVRSP